MLATSATRLVCRPGQPLVGGLAVVFAVREAVDRRFTAVHPRGVDRAVIADGHPGEELVFALHVRRSFTLMRGLQVVPPSVLRQKTMSACWPVTALVDEAALQAPVGPDGVDCCGLVGDTPMIAWSLWRKPLLVLLA